MLAGYYTIASGMMASQKNLDTIGNNILNAETTGFRAQKVVNSAFEKEMLSVNERSGSNVLGDGKGSPAVVIDSVASLFQSGAIQSTGRGLDVSINGEGFFNVTGEDGTTYMTRDGAFDLDTEGYLVLPGFGRVVGESGYIKAESSDVTISSDGTVSSAVGIRIGKIKITAPTDYSTLERTANGMFTSANAVPVSNNYQLQQNSLEGSNVNLNVELTSLVAAQRAFQSCSTALTAIDTLNRKAAQQLASI